MPCVLVDDQVVDRQVGEGGDGRAPLEAAAGGACGGGAPKTSSSVRTTSPTAGDHEARRALADDDREPLRRSSAAAIGRLDVVLGQDLPQALGLPLVVHHQAHREALGAPAPERIGELAEVRR